MAACVFISYARSASRADAEALAQSLGELAFLDTSSIEDGIHFPQYVLTSLLDARLVVILATREYAARPYCRVERRLVLAACDRAEAQIVLGLGEGSSTVLDAVPLAIADQSWPPASATQRLAALVRERLKSTHAPLRHRLAEEEARKLATALLEELSVPEPQSLQGLLCSLPPGVAGQSIGTRFVGRAEELRRIHSVLSEGSEAAQLTCRLAGGGGFGKTRLAVEYLHRYGPRYYPGGLFWINAASETIEVEFWRVLKAIHPAVPNLGTMRSTGRDVSQELERELRGINRPVLYVVDNVAEAAPGEDPPELEAFCPALGSVTVLATSRQDTREAHVRKIEVDTLSVEAAILLLTESVAGTGVLPWDEWGRIAAWVGYLPLALDLLNRSLALNSIAPRNLLERAVSREQRSGTQELDRLRNALRGQVPRDAVHGITEAFSISLEKLDPRAREVALLLAQLAPAPVPEAFLEALEVEWKGPEVRAALRARHFVTGGGELSFGVMHRLMSDYLRSVAVEEEPDLLRRACNAIAQVMTQERCQDPREWPLMNLCRLHAELLLDRGLSQEAIQLQASEIGTAAALLASAQGDYAGARPLQERVLEVRTRVLGAEHPDTLGAMNNLAMTLWGQGDYGGARQLQKRVLEARTRVLGAEHPDTLTAMNNLGETLRVQGDYAGARPLQERVLEARTRVLGAEHPDTLGAMNNLAMTLRGQGDYGGARQLQERVLEARTRVLGAEHPDTLTAMNNLANTLLTQGDYAGARQLLERVLEARTRVLGEEHPGTLGAMGNLANTLFAQADYVGARQLQERALEAWTRVLGEEHPDTLTAMNNLGSTLLAQGDDAGARQLQERVLEARARVLGEEHRDTLGAMGNLGNTLLAQGDYAGARQLQERALEAWTRVLGAEHPDRLTAMNNLALTLRGQGDYGGARPLQERVLEARTRVLGEEHPDTLDAMNNLANTLFDQGDYAGARQLQERALEARTRVMGEDHSDTLTAMNNLGETLRAQGEYAGARQLQERVLEARTRVLGAEHPDTLTTMTDLGNTLFDQGDYAGARQLQERVLEARTRVLGTEHPDTLTAMNNLGETFLAQGEYAGARPLQERVLEARTRVLGAEHPDTLGAMNNLAMTLRVRGDYAGARPLHERVLEARTRVLGAEHPDTLDAMNNLALTLRSQAGSRGGAAAPGAGTGGDGADSGKTADG
jgi:tetratricopeptide (TPR) repeat protein